MSKKVRRVKRSDNKKKQDNQQENKPEAPKAAASRVPNRRQIGKQGQTPSRRPRGRNRIRQVPIEEMREEYAYVIKDLRRIFILALVMFVLLFLANLFLPPFF